jgi:hypothetical protein
LVYAVAGSLALLLTLAILLRNPFSQTVLARLATSYLSRELGVEVKINRLDIRSHRKLDLHGFLIKDHRYDTLINIPGIKLRIKGLSYLRGDIVLHSIKVDSADIRITKYEGQEESNLSMILRYFSTEDTSRGDPSGKGFGLNQIELVNSRFSFMNLNEPAVPDIIDFNYPRITNLFLKANDLYISGDTLSVHIEFLSLFEKSGFRVDTLSCFFRMEPSSLQADSLLIKTRQNRLDMNLKFSFDQFSDFGDFLHSVELAALFKPSQVNLAEVRYFAPVMGSMDNPIQLTGNIRGTVNDFRARNFEFSTGQFTRFKGNIQMHGLPNFQETYSHLSIDDMVTTADDVKSFNIPSEEGKISLPEFLDELGMIKINGKFTGFYNDFVSYANFHTAIGKINTDLLLRMDPTNTMAYSGSITTSQFNAGKLFQAEADLRRIDLTATVNGSGVTFDDMQLTMDGEIGLFEFRNNSFRDIVINGELVNKKFSGMLDMHDELINLSFNGIIDYSQNIPVYNFSAQVRDAWLDRINLVTRDSSSVLSTNITINFMGDRFDNMQGIIILDSTYYFEGEKHLFVKDMTLSITRDMHEFNIIRFYSDFLDATVEGVFNLNKLPNDMVLLLGMHLDTLFTLEQFEYSEPSFQDFNFSLDMKNTEILTELFIPQLTIADRSHISGGFNSRVNNLYFNGHSPEINYGGISLINWYCGFALSDEFIQFTTGTETLFLSDTLTTNNTRIVLTAGNNNIHYQLSWHDLENKSFTHGELDGQVRLLGKTRFKFNLDKADIVFADTLWSISPDNFIIIDTNYLHFSNFSLGTQSQRIDIHGTITPDPKDTLSIGLTHFDLSNFDLILDNSGIDLDGMIDGTIQVIDYFNSPFYLANLDLAEFRFNGEHLGDAHIVTSWDPVPESFQITAGFIYTGNIGQRKIIGVNGNYFPNRESENFDVVIELDNFRLNALEPFISSFSSGMEGLASGKIKLTGTPSAPEFNGEIDLARVSLLIDYLNVRYFFADKIIFDKDRFYFDNMVLYDSLNNRALCSGEFRFGNMKDLSLNLSISTNNLTALNTTRRHNSVFYGRGLVSGNISIHGPTDNLVMNIGIRSERGTSIKMPISSDITVGTSDYIIFVNTGVEEEEQENAWIYETDLGGMTLNLDLDVTPDADIQIFMPYDMGELRSRGRGNLKMNVLPSGTMTMNGEYVIDRGSFFLTLQRIINRNFELRKGGTVTWRGDPNDAQINVEAVYKVKTTLGEFGPEQDSATRVAVDCIIALRNRLLDPEIYFTVEFPDLKDDTRQYIYARLDTSNQAMMSQQMISLLVLNSFSQSTGYSGSVGFNTYSLITNQLNNWLSQISSDFDIGVNYRPGDDISAQEVELALSTQLWDDRISIDGNIGVRGTDNTQNTNNIVGEVNVEVKLTRDGRFRAKAFNKSNNDLIFRNYSPYTQGVGVFYTQDFNRFSDLFIRKKRKDGSPIVPDDRVSR